MSIESKKYVINVHQVLLLTVETPVEYPIELKIGMVRHLMLDL